MESLQGAHQVVILSLTSSTGSLGCQGFSASSGAVDHRCGAGEEVGRHYCPTHTHTQKYKKEDKKNVKRAPNKRRRSLTTPKKNDGDDKEEVEDEEEEEEEEDDDDDEEKGRRCVC